MSGAYSEFFSGRGHQFLSLFQAQIFSAELILSNLRTKNDSRGFGSMLPRKIFENLRTVMVILVLFKHFLGKLVTFLAFYFECFTNDV